MTNFKKILLGLGLISAVAIAAEAPEVLQKDGLRVGRAASTADKYLEINTNDGANNPKLKVKNSDKAWHATSNTFKVGSGVAGDKYLEAEVGASPLNPKLKWDNATSKWQFTNDGTTYSDLGSGTGGGGFFDPSDLLDVLDRSEAGTFSSKLPNEARDNFTTTLGTQTNMLATGGNLSLSGLNTSGSYERTRLTNITAKATQGVLRGRLQQLAPKTTAFSPSSTASSVTIVLSGDVSNMFQTSKNILIVKKTTNDEGGVFFKAVRDTTTSDIVAFLPVSSVSYAGGPDETSIVVTNTNNLDLDLDVSAANYYNDLRIIPFDVKIFAKGTGSYQITDAALTDLISLNNIGIAGESLFTSISGLTGSALLIRLAHSPSRQYAVSTVIEQTATTNICRFYSVNYMNTWTSFGCTSTGIASLNEYDGSFQFLSNSSLIVADNGKAVYMGIAISGGFSYVTGHYSDLSVGVPVLSSMPTTGIDSANNLGGAGVIYANGTNNMFGTVWGDTTDLSSVFTVGYKTSDNTMWVRQYTSGGSSYSSLLTQVGTLLWNTSPHYVAVSGTSGSHRFFLIGTEGTNGKPYYSYLDEGSGTVVGQGLVSGGANNTYLVAAKSLSTKLQTVWNDTTNNLPKYIFATTSGTPSISSINTVSSMASSIDQFNGWKTASPNNYWKTYVSSLVVNPSDSTNMLASYTEADPDASRRSIVYEVRNDATWQGPQISQLTSNTTESFRDTSSNQQVGQTFTANSNRFRTFGLRVYQNGKIASGNTITAKIYATSAGLPTGAALATSTNTYDPSLITRSTSGQVLQFTFNTPSLTNATVYALVLEGTFTVSASNYLSVISHNTNPYANGQSVTYNGAVWSAVTNHDWFFEINAEFVHLVQTETIPHSYPSSNNKSYSFENQIDFIDSTNFALVNRNIPFNDSASYYPMQGNVQRRIINLGSGGNASIIGSSLYGGFMTGTYDPYLALNVMSGVTANQRKNTTTGALDATRAQEDRSPTMYEATYSTLPTYSAQASLQGGIGATSMSILYSEIHKLLSLSAVNPVFVMEVELITPGSFAARQNLIANYSATTTSGGFDLYIDTSGILHFDSANTAGMDNTISSTVLSVSTLYKVKVTGDGTSIRLYLNGSEVSYSAQETNGYTMNSPNTGDGVTVGSFNNNAGFSTCQFGYYRIAVGTTTFVNSTYVDEVPYTSLINAGTKTYVKKVGGTNGATNGTNFYSLGVLAGTSTAMVDSYDADFIYNYTFDETNQGDTFMLKLQYGRASTRNISVFPGLNFRAVK